MYEDVLNKPDSGDKRSQDFRNRANLYFSIGQNEETINQSFCWIWADGKLFTKKGPTTHIAAFHSLTSNIDNNYRGWYDPVQNLISIQFPSKHYVPGATYI